MKRLRIVSMLVLVMGALAGCGGRQETAVSGDTGAVYTSQVLRTDYEGALDAATQLALGTLKLEEAGSAVTPDQAKTLLPLWQALQGGVTAQAEVNAVLKQIEETMTPQQLQAIAEMHLTQEDMQAWMEEHDIRPGSVFSGTLQGTPGPRGVPPAGFGGGLQGTPPAGWSGEPPGGGTLPPEMATRRAEFESMSEEERQALRATMEAGGGWPGGRGRGFGGGRQFMILLNPLIELLEARAAGS